MAFKKHIDKKTLRFVFTDPFRFSRILHNLFSNAIKLIEKGAEPAITQKILEKMDLKIEIDTKPGVGSPFSFTVELKLSDENGC
ncbi:MAG: hypothetical protein ACLFQE_05645 [Thermotogota bacterium]